MAGVTLLHCVRSQQRKPVLMLLLCPDLLPAHDGVAALTPGAKLATVHVGVTVSAALARVGKDQLGMALATTHAFVASPQGVRGGVVIELQKLAERTPTGVCVAVLAWCGELAVWAPFHRAGCRCSLAQQTTDRQKQHA